MPSSTFTALPVEILLRIVHDPDLSLSDRKNTAKTCRRLDEVERDELAYRQLVRRATGLRTLPETAGGSWMTQYKHVMQVPRRGAGIDDRRMGIADYGAFYDECSNQEGWD